MSDLPSITTLGGLGESRLEEKKSVFLGHAMPIRSEEEALAFIREQKKKFADARHNVWCYRLQGDITVRCSDDGEPQGTAGVPILDVLRKSGVSDAVLVVTRYFGGILLGAPGLVRAYTTAAHLAVEQAKIVTYKPFVTMMLKCSYGDFGKYQAELAKLNAKIEGTDFTDTVTVRFSLPKEITAEFCNRVLQISNGILQPETIGEYFG